jgi:hypothetical protein
MVVFVLKSSYSPSMTLSYLTIPQSTFSGTGTLSGTRSTCIFYHLIDCCNSLRRRTHLPKRGAELTEDTPRKRRRPLPVANSAAAGGHAPVGGVGLNGFIFPTPGHLGGGRSTESSSSSSSSDTSSNTSSDDTSSNSESTSGSSSDSDPDLDLDSDSDSTSSLSSDDLRRHVPRPPPSFEHQKKPSQPRYVTSTLSIVSLSISCVRPTGLSQYHPDLGIR